MNKESARAWAITTGTKPEPIAKAELTTTEAALRLGLSANQVIRRCDDKTLPCHYVGTHRRILAADVERLLGKGPQPAFEQVDLAHRLEQIERKVDALLAIERARIEATRSLAMGVSNVA